MDEARRSPRRHVLKSGSIRFGDAAISCVLRNLSLGGVALDVGSQVGIPDQFTLIVHAENNIHSCAVVWRKERRIGVAFY
jgi:PilZ domain-containing protein